MATPAHYGGRSMVDGRKRTPPLVHKHSGLSPVACTLSASGASLREAQSVGMMKFDWESRWMQVISKIIITGWPHRTIFGFLILQTRFVMTNEHTIVFNEKMSLKFKFRTRRLIILILKYVTKWFERIETFLFSLKKFP